MPQAPTVLIADSSDERRRHLGLALYEGGYEVINAVNGEEALRFTAGLDPTLVIAHTDLDGLAPLELHTRLTAAGLDLPPLLILCDQVPDLVDDQPEGAIYHLACGDLAPSRFLYQVRLLLLAREIGGELSESIDVLYGDLTRISLGDLLNVLRRFVITGHVRLSVGPDAGIWMSDGQVNDAHWGQTRGTKAFNRVAGLHGGSFVVDLESPPGARLIETDMDALLKDAVEEKFQLDALFRDLPSLNSRVEMQMQEEFFAIEFSSLDREVLTCLQKSKNLADLVDRLPETDLEVLRTVANLREQGFLLFKQPEHKVHVVTDSSCDLLPALTRRRHITVVPLSVIFGKKVFKDGIDIQPDQFYALLRDSDVFPSTSPPSKGEFAEAYRRLVTTGDIVSVHISTKQSLTGEHARQAAESGIEEFISLREEAGGPGQPKLRIVDSKSDSVGLGMLVIFASRMAQRGLTVDEIATRLDAIQSRFHMLFLVDTLEFLRKGGRIGGARALLGTLLGIKPILGVVDGEVHPIDKVRGGSKAHPRLIELFQERVEPGLPVFAGLAHAGAPKWAGNLGDLLEKEFSIIEMMQSEIGPVVGAHAGPGTVGAVLFQPTDEEVELLKAD